MKICHVSSGIIPVPPKDKGAVERIITNLGKEFIKLKHEFHIVDLKWGDESPIINEPERLHYHRVGKFPYNTYGRIKALYFALKLLVRMNKIVKKNKLDIVHFHVEILGAAIILLKKILHVPLAFTLHNGRWTDLSLYKGKDKILGYPFELLCLKYSDSIICLNSAMRKNVQERLKKREKVVVIPNGVDTELFSPMEALNDNSNVTKKNLLCVGAIMRAKNQHIIIEACKELNNNVFDNIIFIGHIGEEKYYNYLEYLIKQYKMGDKVKFIARVENSELPKYYRGAAILVHPSTFEGSASVVLEAMSCGSCVLASDIPSHRDFIKHLENGLLFDPYDAKDLTNKIQQIFADEELYKKIRINARRYIEENRSWKKIAKRYENQYWKIIEDKTIGSNIISRNLCEAG